MELCKKRRYIICLYILLTWTLSPYYFADNIDDLEEEIKELVKEIEKYDTSISEVNESVDLIENNIKKNDEKIVEGNDLIDELTINIGNTQEKSDNALLLIQKSQNNNFFLKSLSESLTKDDFFSSLSRIMRITEVLVSELYTNISYKQELKLANDTNIETKELLEEEKTLLKGKSDELAVLISDSEIKADELNIILANKKYDAIVSKMKPGFLFSDKVAREDLMSSVGINVSDFKYVEFILNKESTWNHLAVNSSSGAYGLCQALPASKLATAGSDWKQSPKTQMKWCNNYAIQRYGSWEKAHSFWVENSWW